MKLCVEEDYKQTSLNVCAMLCMSQQYYRHRKNVRCWSRQKKLANSSSTYDVFGTFMLGLSA